MNGADIDAVAAARTRRHEGDFIRRARRTKPALGRDALLGPPRDLPQQLADRALEEFPPLVQKLGSKLSCQRNCTRLLLPSAA